MRGPHPADPSIAGPRLEQGNSLQGIHTDSMLAEMSVRRYPRHSGMCGPNTFESACIQVHEDVACARNLQSTTLLSLPTITISSVQCFGYGLGLFRWNTPRAVGGPQWGYDVMCYAGILGLLQI